MVDCPVRFTDTAAIVADEDLTKSSRLLFEKTINGANSFFFDKDFRTSTLEIIKRIAMATYL